MNDAAQVDPRLEIGANQPPADANPLLDRLRTDHADLISRRDELLGGIDRAPEAIEDEKTAGIMADFVQKQIDKFLKRAKAVHADEKEPYLSGGRTVDGFWHSLIDDIETGKLKLNAARKKFADDKAAKERKAREEAARLAREEQERLQREAEEQAAKLREEKDLQAAVEAEEAAEAARLVAEKAAKVAAAKPAEMGRTRGEHGGMTTLKQFWNFSDLDRATLDLEALREHIPAKALDQAVRSFVDAGGRELKGVRIYEDTRL
ncbi:MAG: hypothetical protein IH994_06020 [Proteobacteria bacterium]|nr:hypothetical protein [Pseudomonadota bacterium]